jgi:hypothetical protein
MGLQHSLCSVMVDRRAIASVAASAALIVLTLLASAPASAETRGYVVSWFATATNNAEFAINCPQAAKDPGSRFATTGKRRADHAFVDGKEVAAFDYPDALDKDPNIETVVGPNAYGFDLGGPAANKFTDPETHAKVDDQLWRAVGCTTNFQFTPPTMPYMEGQAWNSGYADAAPAWAIQISSPDLNKDGPVTLTLDRTFDHLMRDALGGIRSDVTYVIDPSPRSHNVLTGEIKNGVLLVNSGSLWLQGEAPFYIQVDLKTAHMRMHSTTGGNLVGYWGGYTDWHKWAYMYTSRCGGGFDCVGIYRSVEKLADAGPDPVTGKNQLISTTWRMEAVPAYLATRDGKILASATPDGLGGQIQPPQTVASTAIPAAAGSAQTATKTALVTNPQ